jgi:hypothetical protein
MGPLSPLLMYILFHLSDSVEHRTLAFPREKLDIVGGEEKIDDLGSGIDRFW